MNTSQKINQLEEKLQELIQSLEPISQDPVGRGRPRILPSMCLWVGFLVCVLRGMNSQLAIWRTISEKGLWYYPRFKVSDQAVYKRLEKEGTKTLETMFSGISSILKDRLTPFSQTDLAPFASQVVAIDNTTLDRVMRVLPALREIPKHDLKLLAGRLAAIYDIRLQQWVHVEHIENPLENEKNSAVSLLQYINKGAMILADMGYFSFKWFDHLTDEGYYWVSRLRNKTSYHVIHTFYKKGTTFDGIVWLGVHRSYKAKHAVRLVSFQAGDNTFQYITNVLDPRQLSIQDMTALYARRWDIELAFKLIKRELGLHMFWSAKPIVIMQQIWAVLIISQVLQALRLEIAGLAKVDPFEVSLKLMIEYIPIWGADGTDVISFIVEHGQSAGFIRPSRRIQPKSPPIEIGEILPLPKNIELVRKPYYADH